MAWVSIGEIDQLSQLPVQCFRHADREYVLIYHDSQFYMLDSACPHKAAALCDGDLRKGTIECPWHKARFDIQTGRGLNPLAGGGVSTYSLRQEGDQLLAELT